jgi:putative ABC transport system permease protein
MGKTFFVDILREIKHSFGRFFAIFAIVLIGVAFFVGVTASSSDMKHSSDHYYDTYNMMDLRMVSTVGFTKDDIQTMRNVDGVAGLFATHTVDAVSSKDGVQRAIRVMTVPDANLATDNADYINQLRIKEGRLPNNPGECVVKYENTLATPVNIGDTITLSSGNDTDILDTLNIDRFEVVGIVYTPYYLSYDMGQTNVGSGKITNCIMIRDGEFKSSYYTEVFATVSKAKELDTYSDAYWQRIDEVSSRMKTALSHSYEDRLKDSLAAIQTAKQDKITEIKNQIHENVRSQLYSQYQAYYPGMDVTSMVEPLVDNVYQNTLKSYDFSSVDDYFKAQEDDCRKVLSGAKSYVLDRDAQYSFRDYKSSADRMKAIATVFPLFFIFVSALVCLTTMTRMVDEQRELIGTYKALGYGKGVIALKYILYAFIASILGGILGCIVGLKLFPTVIYNTWNILYEMPPITYANHTILSIIAIASMVLVTCVASFYASYNELVEVPSQLMRPKSPKKGKKILLEHIPVIWKHFSFSRKVTFRNIFRYKKRFVMTIIGIAGCTALLMAGFGIKDSISGLIKRQYSEIFKYDACITMADDVTGENRDAIISSVTENSAFNEVQTLYKFMTAAKNKDATTQGHGNESEDQKDITVNVVSDTNRLKDFVTFRSRINKIPYELNNDGVMISEKLANDLDVKQGDTITIEDANGNTAEVKVAHVIEMYVNHYIFMTKEYYQTIFGQEPQDNCIFAKLNETSDVLENELGNTYLNMKGISSIQFFTSNIDRFTTMIKSLNIITYVLIISAGLLAFVVLYNLSNVNVSERIREIATIKVLGFYDKEVAMYVYRENIIITIIGALVGLILGVILHAFIMKTVEMDYIMFGNEINASSYILSFALTFVFSAIVNGVMYIKLRKIPMVESLKSIE